MNASTSGNVYFADGASLFAYILVGVVCAISTLFCYNIYFHPLARFPGPKSYAASPIPVALAQLGGRFHRFTQAAHEKYGSVVRISPNELSIISAAAWDDIYARRQKNPPLARDPTFFNDILVDPRTLTMADDTNHIRLRKSMNGAFAPRALAEQEPILTENVDLFMDKLEERAQQRLETDLRLWYNYATFDLIGDFAFGESFRCLESSKYHEWVQFVLDHFYVATLLQVVHRFRPLNKLLAMLLPASLIQKKEAHHRMALDKVRRRVQKDTQRPDFISHVLKALDTGMITIDELENQASIIILAGSETTAVALTFATYFLLVNPHIMDCLLEELRSNFENESQIDVLSINKLNYLQAVIQETLRLAPPITNGFPRQVPPEGAMVDGLFIPGGSVVNISHWSAYHSSKNFFKPDQFCPERWLGDSLFGGDTKDAFQPFSVGPRNCIGKK
ncbi:sterigmatocystin biosynthesis P450 monooxygenase stcL [Penicillium brasilianum]|uniref:Sterigmatocystin biosynthesis P450 monooxygenase stcL n=1 Tax=Penicillium brasilianum TaxID=104259 RepID=A0A1S9RFY8_PENBI|nr:sterigmatocystin biosynthesis P450 monooxygenase stcL [Penicillium brasilianum]